MPNQKPWFETFFDDFRPLFGLIPRKQTNKQVCYIIKLLGLKKGMTFLDCPCGIGRISIPMAQRGIRVTGVDITESYLEELRSVAVRKHLKIDTLCSDMRRINFKNRFDAAGNLWTSFGYFESESQNLLVLKKIYQALKPGGRFLLHVINRDWILSHYTETSWDEFAGIISFEKRKFEYATSINRGVWRFLKDGTMKEIHVGIRMYSYHEFIAMFRKVGFVDIQGFGNEKGEPIDRKNMMMWIVATKPKRGKR